ncbi:hypothetical protein ACKWTF_003041 [Chironomus riparius]
MSDPAVEVAPTTPVASPAKAKKEKKPKTDKVKKPKAPRTHPPVSEMVVNAVKTLKERGGSSLQAIKKFLVAQYKVDTDKLAPFIKKFLKSAVEKGQLLQTKGKGASGSFKLPVAAKKEKVVKPKKVAAEKKPKKAPAKPKNAGEKKVKKTIAKKPKAAAATKIKKPIAKTTKKTVAAKPVVKKVAPKPKAAPKPKVADKPKKAVAPKAKKPAAEKKPKAAKKPAAKKA